MQRFKRLIKSLETGVEMERRLVDYYKRAGDNASDPAMANVMHALQQKHYLHLEQLDHQHVRLQQQHGEGIVGEALESIGQAFAGVVAGLPVWFIDSEMQINLDTMKRMESDLRTYYEDLLGLADDETASLLERLVAEESVNLAQLATIDTLDG